MTIKRPTKNRMRTIAIELTDCKVETDADGIHTIIIENVSTLDMEATHLSDILEEVLNPEQIDGIVRQVRKLNRLNVLGRCIR